MTATSTLTKTRSNKVTVKIGISDFLSDGEWRTKDGFRVVRVHFHGARQYMVIDHAGRSSMQETLREARAKIRWLRERGR